MDSPPGVMHLPNNGSVDVVDDNLHHGCSLSLPFL